MKKLLLLTVFLFLTTNAFGKIVCPSGSAGRRHTPKQRLTFESEILSVVEITTECGGCSGFVVGEGLILTAAHCFMGPYEVIKAKFVDRHVSILKLVKSGTDDVDQHPDQDLSLLSGDTHKAVPLKIAKDMKPKELCTSVGYGIERTQKESVCYTGFPHRQYHDLYAMAGEVDYGDSGGPTVNRAGEVIGVNESIAINPEIPLFFVVDVYSIQKFLKGTGVKP